MYNRINMLIDAHVVHDQNVDKLTVINKIQCSQVKTFLIPQQ